MEQCCVTEVLVYDISRMSPESCGSDFRILTAVHLILNAHASTVEELTSTKKLTVYV